ncbi:MAG: hypothetical protein EBT48_07295, partial [Verrucomicrobia bacterium]|nr:hypothetical protein [Verrucomicrobiota bacterium]
MVALHPIFVPSPALGTLPHGAGCGCKLSPAVLDRILHTNEAGAEYPRLIVGNSTRDDAAVYDLGDGRSTEIQRLLGRSLRAVTDLTALGPRSLWIDCDVLSADGGTRTTAITGSCLALRRAIERLQLSGKMTADPLRTPVAAISVGLLNDQPLLDLNYPEDRDA